MIHLVVLSTPFGDMSNFEGTVVSMLERHVLNVHAPSLDGRAIDSRNPIFLTLKFCHFKNNFVSDIFTAWSKQVEEMKGRRPKVDWADFPTTYGISVLYLEMEGDSKENISRAYLLADMQPTKIKDEETIEFSASPHRGMTVDRMARDILKRLKESS